MRILVTGSSGLVGTYAVEHLQTAGHEVVPFDQTTGLDIRNDADIRDAVSNVDSVVHLAAVLGWHGEPADDFMNVNLLGTWRVLRAARKANVGRIVFMSSIDVLGVFKGHRSPDYLPLDDDHPCYPNTPYAQSKRLAEVMCEDAYRTYGLETVVLRPPGVWNDDTYREIRRLRADRASYEWSPFWEYGAFLDVRDLAGAIERALFAAYPGPKPFGLAADETNSSGPTSREWAARIHPDVPWKDQERFETDAHATLLSNERAKEVLGWQPARRWGP